MKTNHAFLIETYTNFSYIVFKSGNALIIFLSVFHKSYIDDMFDYYFHVHLKIIKKSLELKYTYYLLQDYLVNGWERKINSSEWNTGAFLISSVAKSVYHSIIFLFLRFIFWWGDYFHFFLFRYQTIFLILNWQVMFYFFSFQFDTFLLSFIIYYFLIFSICFLVYLVSLSSCIFLYNFFTFFFCSVIRIE